MLIVASIVLICVLSIFVLSTSLLLIKETITFGDNKDKIDIDELSSLVDEVFLLSLSLSTFKPVSSLVGYILNARSK